MIVYYTLSHSAVYDLKLSTTATFGIMPNVAIKVFNSKVALKYPSAKAKDSRYQPGDQKGHDQKNKAYDP